MRRSLAASLVVAAAQLAGAAACCVEAAVPLRPDLTPSPARLTAAEEVAGSAPQEDWVPSDAWPKVQIYWPSGRGPYPVIVYYDGGQGPAAADSQRDTARSLARLAKAVVLAVRTKPASGPRIERISTEVENEGFAAYRWALAHADFLGGDTSPVAVTGSRAGIRLAARVLMRARSAKLQLPQASDFQGLVYPSPMPPPISTSSEAASPQRIRWLQPADQRDTAPSFVVDRNGQSEQTADAGIGSFRSPR